MVKTITIYKGKQTRAYGVVPYYLELRKKSDNYIYDAATVKTPEQGRKWLKAWDYKGRVLWTGIPAGASITIEFEAP